MSFSNSFKASLFSVNDSNFEKYALQLFNHQAKHNQIYGKYVELIGREPQSVVCLEQIPFLPISLFKSQKIVTGDWNPEHIFQSSGTTGTITSKHYVRYIPEYLDNAERIFESQFGSLKEYHILALLPSYLERDNSSLVCMVEYFMQKSLSEFSGFYLDDYEDLINSLLSAYESKRKVLLIGVTFGLLDFIEKHQFNMPELVVMETGGMKGRRKEMVREEVHDQLKKGFGVENIYSEYGMTELLSQAYSERDGLFNMNNTLKVLIRDFNDPYSYQPIGRSGGINVIDLANVDSCAFIETQDLGKCHDQNTFEVIGRFDNSDIRGCNLMVN